MLKTQCGFPRGVQPIHLHCSIIPADKDLSHAITENVEGIKAKHALQVQREKMKQDVLSK